MKQCPHRCTIDDKTGIAPACLKCEVERLRAVIHQLMKNNDNELHKSVKAEAEVERLNAENAKLRAALAFYANIENWRPVERSNAAPTGAPAVIEMGTIARNALGGDK